jgi:hypothetical protein
VVPHAVPYVLSPEVVGEGVRLGKWFEQGRKASRKGTIFARKHSLRRIAKASKESRLDFGQKEGFALHLRSSGTWHVGLSKRAGW